MRGQDGLDLFSGICSSTAGHNPRVLEPVVCIESLVQLDACGKVVDDFFLGLVVGVTGRVERGDAGAVFVPFVIPQALIVVTEVFPVHTHVGKQVGGAEGLENGRDVAVGARIIAVGVVTTVAQIGPQAVDSPVSPREQRHRLVGPWPS